MAKKGVRELEVEGHTHAHTSRMLATLQRNGTKLQPQGGVKVQLGTGWFPNKSHYYAIFEKVHIIGGKLVEPSGGWKTTLVGVEL